LAVSAPSNGLQPFGCCGLQPLREPQATFATAKKRMTLRQTRTTLLASSMGNPQSTATCRGLEANRGALRQRANGDAISPHHINVKALQVDVCRNERRGDRRR
jgi:hypothetical protein